MLRVPKSNNNFHSKHWILVHTLLHTRRLQPKHTYQPMYRPLSRPRPCHSEGRLARKHHLTTHTEPPSGHHASCGNFGIRKATVFSLESHTRLMNKIQKGSPTKVLSRLSSLPSSSSLPSLLVSFHPFLLPSSLSAPFYLFLSPLVRYCSIGRHWREDERAFNGHGPLDSCCILT